MKLNLGCGRDIREGYVNVDRIVIPGTDLTCDLEQPLPIKDDSADEILLVDVLEHIHETLPFMQELWRVAKAGATCEVICPYGASDVAYEDPTHVQRLFPSTFGYFGQPAYWRADYGYRGDWDIESIQCNVSRQAYRLATPDEIAADMWTYWNVVRSMRVVLKAIKPARPALRELQHRVNLVFGLEEP